MAFVGGCEPRADRGSLAGGAAKEESAWLSRRSARGRFADPPVRYRLARSNRLRGTRDFRAVIQGGEKTSGRGLTLFVQRRGGRGQRLGLAVGGRLGDAVTRNRIKRRLREYVRVRRHMIPDGLDLVVAVHRDLSRLDFKTFQAIAEDLFRKAGLLPPPPPQHGRTFGDSNE
jgi:ribonuclease P protein component